MLAPDLDFWDQGPLAPVLRSQILQEGNKQNFSEQTLPALPTFLPVRWHLLVITGELACVPVFHDCVRFLLSFDWGCLLTRESHCGPLERVDAPNQNPATIQILEAVGRWH